MLGNKSIWHLANSLKNDKLSTNFEIIVDQKIERY